MQLFNHGVFEKVSAFQAHVHLVHSLGLSSLYVSCSQVEVFVVHWNWAACDAFVLLSGRVARIVVPDQMRLTHHIVLPFHQLWRRHTSLNTIINHVDACTLQLLHCGHRRAGWPLVIWIYTSYCSLIL